jgi:hypothetical protein
VGRVFILHVLNKKVKKAIWAINKKKINIINIIFNYQLYKNSKPASRGFGL